MSEDQTAEKHDGISFRSVCKRFGSLIANDDITFRIAGGSFHALLGENGAGKTTLMRILAGELRADSGEILIAGERGRFRSPREARTRGVRLVHQHPLLIPNLSVVENFLLDDVGGVPFPKVDAVCSTIRSEAERFGIRLDPRRPVWEFAAAQRQWLEVFRALFGGGRILILDEPTSLLSPIEGDALLDRLKTLTESGLSVVLITHKLREVFKYADVVTVLRKGRRVATEEVGSTSEKRLASMMVGGSGDLPEEAILTPHATDSVGRPLIELKDVTCVDGRGRTVLNRVSLVLSRREVLGVAGVSGNGQVELAQIVAGVRMTGFAGIVRSIGDERVERRYIPDDRIRVGSAATLSVCDNLTLRDFRIPPCSRWGVLRRAIIRRRASERVSMFQIQTPSLNAPVGLLSGGNIQRVVVARELDGKPDLVVAHNPTAGLDLATTTFVRRQLRRIASANGAVLLISDDLDELMGSADRILVLHGGAVTGNLDRARFDRILIASWMAGGVAPGAPNKGPTT